MTANPATRRVVFIAYPGVTLLDVAGPLQIFAEANAVSSIGRPLYDITLASEVGVPLETDTGISIETVSLDSVPEPINKLIVSGGIGVFEACGNVKLLEQLQAENDLLPWWLRPAWARSCWPQHGVCPGGK